MAVIVGNTPPGLAAKTATTTTPIVFIVTADPLALGLVSSLNRPSGNVTGVSTLGVEVAPKQLELLHQMVPTATTVALLVNPVSPVPADSEVRQVQAAARGLGLQTHVLHASTEADLDMAFASLAQVRADALLIGPDPFFTARSKRLGGLAIRHAVPAMYWIREFAAFGGLMSYGGSLMDAFRQAGVYATQILKGKKPSDLPVQQPTKFELVINVKTAKALALTIPDRLLAIADEVIE